MSQLPDWVYRSIVEDTLEWDKAIECSFREFSGKYTLHDSIWIGLFYDVAYENNVTLGFIWDAVWLPDDLARSSATISEWPLLFIKMENVSEITASGYKDVGGISRGIAGAAVEETDDKWRLAISDHYGGSVSISFSGRLKFLGLDVNRKVLPI